MSASFGNLVKWLNTFNLDETVKTASDLSNGVCLVNVLSQISSPFFNEEWSSKLKTDTSNNWRLKASNLRKILKKLLDFYHQELQFNVPENHQPDVNSIAEKNDEKESSKLIQLLLGCAVNCDNKEEYIQRIMCMEESVQHSIMLSIKELMLSESVNVTDHEAHHSHAQSVNNSMEFKKLLSDNDSLVHRCNELDQQVLLLSEERAALKAENEKLNQRVNHVDILDDASTPLGRRFQQLQKQADQLQDELFKSEAMKDDYKIKCEILEKDLLLMQNKADSLSRLTEETRNMKDELDILRHTSDKVARYEMTISSLKKKIDDMDELRNQLKMTEDKNVKQQEKIFQLEEELKKSSSHRTQLEVQKRQMIDLQLRVTEECNKSDKLQVDLSRCQERFADLVKEKERLLEERNTLKEINEELTLGQSSLPLSTSMSSNIGDDDDDDELVLMSAPLHIRNKFMKLQRENKMLKSRTSNSAGGEELPVLQGLLEESNKRNSELEVELRSFNRKVLELEAVVADLKDQQQQQLQQQPLQQSQLFKANDDFASDFNLNLMRDEIKQLKEQLSAKDREMRCMEEKYALYLQKAKHLFQEQHRSIVPQDIAALTDKLAEKETQIKLLEEQLKINENQERIMLSAFYNMSTNLHKKSLDERLVRGLSNVPQSLLSKQRGVQTRRILSSTPTTQFANR